MDDEIDIEEHDVLDNPAIKTIFPDLSVLKKEISVYDDDALITKPDADVISIESIEIAEDESSCDSVEQPIRIEEGIDFKKEIQLPRKTPFRGQVHKPFFSNKIILGSKPIQEIRFNQFKYNNYEQNIKPFLAKVFLNDVAPYLSGSGRFCSICQILFSQKEDLASHNKASHCVVKSYTNHMSSKVEIVNRKKFTCNKCRSHFSSSSNLSRHLRNIHNVKFFGKRKQKHKKGYSSLGRINNITKNRKPLPSKTCIHCKKTFSSQKSLIEHIYKILQSSKLAAKTQIKLTESRNKLRSLLLRKQKSNLTDKIVNVKKRAVDRAEKNINPQQSSNYIGQENSFSFYKCCYCSYYFKDKTFFINHLLKKHKDKNATNMNKVKFDSTCKFCSAHCETFYSYNVHLQKMHNEKVHNTFKIQPTLCLMKVELILAGKSNPQMIKDSKLNRSNDNQIHKEISNSNVKRNCPDITNIRSKKFKNLGDISADGDFAEPEKTIDQSQRRNKRRKNYPSKSTKEIGHGKYLEDKSHDGDFTESKVVTKKTKSNRKRTKITKPPMSFKEIENDVYLDDVGGESDFPESEVIIEQSQRKSKRTKTTNTATSYKEIEDDEYLDDTRGDFPKPVLDKTLVLKGILFKCKKCDIHFLSAVSTMNHLEHMEMLINWKCLTCNKIFKKHDEFLHNKQHSFSDEFDVYELSDTEFSRVLYKCSKCAIHLNDDKYASHFKLCGSSLTESAYCTTCDILLENSIMPDHERKHKTAELTSTDFTVITSDTIINYNMGIYTDQANKKICEWKRERQFYHKNKIKDSLTMVYCDTCKCFIGRVGVKAVHKEGRCAHVSRIACRECGLITTSTSLRSHSKLHKIKQNLKLQDFKFYELKNNKQILPPIPDYPKCNCCDVRFLTKVAIGNHICNENEFLTCSICDLKFCDAAFKLHVAFHLYAIKRNRKNGSNISEKEFEEITEKSVSEKENEKTRNSDTNNEDESNIDAIEEVVATNEVEQNSNVDAVKDIVDDIDINAINYEQNSNVDTCKDVVEAVDADAINYKQDSNVDNVKNVVDAVDAVDINYKQNANVDAVKDVVDAVDTVDINYKQNANVDAVKDVVDAVDAHAINYEQNTYVGAVKDVVDALDADAINFKQKTNVDDAKEEVAYRHHIEQNVIYNPVSDSKPLQGNGNSQLIKDKKITSADLVHEINRSVTKTDKLKTIAGSIKRVSDFELFTVIYCCAYCYLTVNTYDKAVEHCQDHYSGVDIKNNINTCPKCKMKYDRRFYSDHKVLHNTRQSTKQNKVLKFDAVYFAVDYGIWINNLFQSLEPDIMQSILDRSIYKHEGRVKLNVIQDQEAEGITVYKCNVCQMFVDPDTILNHAENSCFRLRNHPCSFCGILYISHVSRMSHETAHQNIPDTSVKSLKIVVFNQEQDIESNKSIIINRTTFIFFQCRKCNALFERFQCRTHECNSLNLKSCLTCGFFIYNTDYKSHILKHESINGFFHNFNVKIIRFGCADKKSSSLPSNFRGIVMDYIFYKCTKCDVCVEMSQIAAMEHNCSDENSKIKCSQCYLTFLKKRITKHCKSHESDPYFVKENFNIIPWIKEKEEITEDRVNRNGNVVAGSSTKSEIGFKKKALDSINNFQKTIPKIVEKIYKCNCGLHFLDKLSIDSHFGHCSTRISKQICSKCCLLFTPKDLFAHLLKHHQDKKILYSLNIVQMSKEKNKIIDLYKCSICNLHFRECEKAKEHFDQCLNSICESKKCEKCELLFDISSFDTHEASHHDDDVADFEIIEIKNASKIPFKNNTLDNDMQNLTEQAEAVFDSNFILSADALSRINLNNYSNKIYKCVQCDIHFITENTYRRHTVKCSHEAFTSTQKKCNLCGLNFTLQSLCKHIYIHHTQMKLELSDIIIKTSLSQDD